MEIANREALVRRGPPRVAVCIATHRRPQGLARLLVALDGQRLPEPAPALRIVVVDNDPDESARPVCREAATWLGIPLGYATEKRRGIPQARNAALALALGDADFIAMTDDDCEPAPDWLDALLRAAARYDADAVAGPCLARFEQTPPEWFAAGGFFDAPRFATGTPRPTAYTHNVLVRTAAIAALDALLDERLAEAGGSDSEFFQRFARAGHRIVWADDAVVTERVPASRTTLGWLLRRAFRIGTATAFIDRLHACGTSHTRAVVRARLALHGSWCVAKALLLLVMSAGQGRAAAASALRLGVYGAGRIAGLFGVLTRAYAVTDGG